MQNNYDAIIIGAGPAGSIAGYLLAKAKLKVLIIEKSTFPRRKICGGGLTHHALSAIPFDVTPVIDQQATWGYLASRGRVLFPIHNEQPISYLVQRSSFDTFLLENARLAGANCRMGDRITGFEGISPIIVNTTQGQYATQYLIGADGVHSMVAKAAGLINNRRTSQAYEARLDASPNPKETALDAIIFDFGTVLGGYGWIFPKSDHLNVGVCKSWPGKQTSKRQLLRFIRQHPGLSNLRVIDIRAYPVPMGGDQHLLHKNQILLIGDAANLADPWLGEGLYYAFASAQLAADTILAHKQKSLKDLSSYTEAVNRTIVSQFRYARKLSILVNSFPMINTSILKSSRSVQKMVIDLLRGDRSYHQIFQEIKMKIPRAFRKIFQQNQ